MKKLFVTAAVAAFVALSVNSVFAQTQDTTKKTTTTVTTTTTVQVPTLDVGAILNANPDYSTAANAVKAANLGAALQATGPFTIFAPNNAAFSKLPAGTLDGLLKDPVALATVLKGHVVNGKWTKADIIKALTTGHGKATLTTIDGQNLTLAVSPTQTLQLTNAAGNTAEVTVYDIIGTNGVVNGINGVLLPKK